MMSAQFFHCKATIFLFVTGKWDYVNMLSSIKNWPTGFSIHWWQPNSIISFIFISIPCYYKELSPFWHLFIYLHQSELIDSYLSEQVIIYQYHFHYDAQIVPGLASRSSFKYSLVQQYFLGSYCTFPISVVVLVFSPAVPFSGKKYFEIKIIALNVLTATDVILFLGSHSKQTHTCKKWVHIDVSNSEFQTNTAGYILFSLYWNILT